MGALKSFLSTFKGVTVIFSPHKKAYALRRAAGEARSLGHVSVANSYQRARRLGDLVLLCDASWNDAPLPTAKGKLDAIQLLPDGIEKLAVAAPVPVVDAVVMGELLHCLTPDGLVSYAL